MTSPHASIVVCPRCGNALLPEAGGWACYSDDCEINRQPLRDRARRESAEIVVRLVVRCAWFGFLAWVAWRLWP